MFSTMMAQIQANTVNTIFKLDLKAQLPQEMLQVGAAPVIQMFTNENQIASVLSGEHNTLAEQAASADGSGLSDNDSMNGASNGNPVIIKADSTPAGGAEPEIGRNDPCPCGSGKKYKKCHGL